VIKNETSYDMNSEASTVKQLVYKIREKNHYFEAVAIEIFHEIDYQDVTDMFKDFLGSLLSIQKQRIRIKAFKKYLHFRLPLVAIMISAK